MADKYIVVHETTPFINHQTHEVSRYGDEVELPGRKPSVLRGLVEQGVLAPVGSDEAKRAIAAAEKARKIAEQEG